MVELEKMSRTALVEMVDRYPWSAAVRAILLQKLMDDFGFEVAEGQYCSDCLYFPPGERMSAELYASGLRGASYKDSGAVLKDVLAAPAIEIFDGTDFFSRRDYEAVRREGDTSIGKIAVVDYSKPAPEPSRPSDYDEEGFVIFTETLARIYAEQGYPDRAIEIYKSLSLQSPEKSAYFATLIEKLKN